MATYSVMLSPPLISLLALSLSLTFSLLWPVEEMLVKDINPVFCMCISLLTRPRISNVRGTHTSLLCDSQPIVFHL